MQCNSTLEKTCSLCTCLVLLFYMVSVFCSIPREPGVFNVTEFHNSYLSNLRGTGQVLLNSYNISDQFKPYICTRKNHACINVSFLSLICCSILPAMCCHLKLAWIKNCGSWCKKNPLVVNFSRLYLLFLRLKMLASSMPNAKQT